MAIERWDPFREMVSLRDAVNTLFQESFVRPGSLVTPGMENAGWAVPLDVNENEDAFVVKASLPGVKPEDVQITIQGDMLTVRGETKAEQEKSGETWHLRERRHGVFQRSIALPTAVNSDRATATHENGVLTLTIPKAEAARPKQIKVSSTSS